MEDNRAHLSRAIPACESGGVIAYPTEAVYGLGCLPLNEAAVRRLLALKRRSPDKGLIVVAEDIKQLRGLVDFDAARERRALLKSWPGPHTWLVPCKGGTPAWLTGVHATLAVRVSAHPVVRALCGALGPLVSTSANPEGAPPARSSAAVEDYFAGQIDYIFPGKITGSQKPTRIRDAMTGEIIRKA